MLSEKEEDEGRKRLNNITSMSLKLKSNLDLKTQVQIIRMPQTYLGRKWYRLLRKTDVENDKLFDVNDLPKAEQKWKRYRKKMHAQRKIFVSETASSFPCETSTVQGGDTLSQILPK